MCEIFTVDAFTRKPFAGNPAGVCLVSEPKADTWMQSIAAEMNLSETAFIIGDRSPYTLRWFTPLTEVSLCGHATLASAHILWSEGIEEKTGTIVFATKSGDLAANIFEDKYELSLPLRSVTETDAQPDINRALGLEPRFTGIYSAEKGDLFLLEAASQEEVQNLSADFAALSGVSGRAFIVTSKSADDDFDFVSRFFAPKVGINEDPVTGSAHCYLAPYWAAKLKKPRLTGYQISRRTGIVECELSDDRVKLRGYAVTITKGKIII